MIGNQVEYVQYFSNGEHQYYHHVDNVFGLLYYIHQLQHTSFTDILVPNTRNIARPNK